MNLEIIGKIAERKIQEGIEEGKFDNLPGMGKPLELNDGDSLPLDVRMANKVLKNAGVLPEWIQVQHEITSEREEMARYRERVAAENVKRRARLEQQKLPADHAAVRQFAEWHVRCRDNYLRRLKHFNTSVLKYSILAPSTAAPFRSLKIDTEMETFDAQFLPLERQPEVSVAASPQENVTKNLARARYQEGAGGGPMKGWTRAAHLFGLGRSREVASEEFDVDEIRRASKRDRS
jgi:hypothetical protein